MVIRRFIMDHKPLVGFDDGLEITYSDIKKTESGKSYVSLYFERPDNERRDGFDYARYDYPRNVGFEDVRGFTNDDLSTLKEHVDKVAHLALEFSEEDAALCLS